MASQNRLSNWPGSHTCFPAHLLRPTSESEVADILATASATRQRVKPIAAGHSWNDIAMTSGSSLSLDGMNRVLAADTRAGTVRVQAGIRIKDLLRALGFLGLTLPVRGSIAEQSIAGAIATGTHGSAPGLGHLGTLVTSMRLVTPDGSIRELTGRGILPGNRDLLAGARVGLGALGVITEVTLSVVDDFMLEERAEPIPVSEAIKCFDEIRTSAPYVKMWWAPHTDTVLVFRYRRTDLEPTISRTAEWIDQNVVNRYVLAGLLGVQRRIPAAVPSIMRTVRPAYLSSRRRVGRAGDVLGLPVPPRHSETEMMIPVEKGAEALERLVGLVASKSFRVGFIQEFRFAAGDDAWLSPMYQRPTCCVGIMAADPSGSDPYQREAERMLRGFGGRPHWGKHFAATPDYLAVVYPRYEDFAALREEVDPAGVLRNGFVDRVFGLS